MAADAPLYACLPPRGADSDAVLSGFLRYVEGLGLELYPHQEEAVLAVMAPDALVIVTHTSYSAPAVGSVGLTWNEPPNAFVPLKRLPIPAVVPGAVLFAVELLQPSGKTVSSKYAATFLPPARLSTNVSES